MFSSFCVFLEFECDSNVDIEKSLSCEWYDAKTETWQRAGCEIQDRNIDLGNGVSGVSCRCTHLTAFAIIQDTIRLKGEHTHTETAHFFSLFF